MTQQQNSEKYDRHEISMECTPGIKETVEMENLVKLGTVTVQIVIKKYLSF